MEDELSVLRDLITEAYPHLAVLENMDEWQAGNFTPPIAFIQTQGVTERRNTLTSYKIIFLANIILHYPESEGVYQPISTEPLRNVLRNNGYSYRGKTTNLFVNINNETFQIKSDQKDRAEISFQLEYNRKLAEQKGNVINSFEIEEGWS